MRRWVAIVVGMGLASGAAAQEQTDLPPAVPAPVVVEDSRPLLNLPALEAFIDGAMAGLMREHHVAGATVSAVSGGDVALAKGYGIAAIEPERPVDAETTLFRIGSISKTFVYTSLMQLVERGRLNLDTPINDVLPPELRVPDQGFEDGIRIRHLMTHSAGFEDSALGHLFTDEASKALPLKDYLIRHRPNRVRPPGEIATYSNYSIGLAGAIIAEISGTDFETYVEEDILTPLGMTHTTFREPLADDRPERIDPALEAKLSQGFAYQGGEWVVEPFEYISPLGPAGAASSSAADMARYMLAHLGFGALDGARILAPETARRMRETLFSNAADVSGISHGFMQYRIAGYDGFGHGGNTLYFHSNMVMVPELELGIFVSTNTTNGEKIATKLPRLIVEQFFPARETPATDVAEGAERRAAEVAGEYLTTRRNYSTIEKLLVGANATVAVSPAADGEILTAAGGEVTRWHEIAPYVYRAADSDDRLVFLRDEKGRVARLSGGFGITAADRLSFFERPVTLWAALGLTGLVSLVVLVSAWRRKTKERRPSRAGLLAQISLVLAAALWLAFLTMFAASLAQIAAAGSQIVFDYPPALLKAAMWLGLFVALATIFAALFAPLSLLAKKWSLWRRARHVVAALLFLATALLLHQWNALGPTY